MKLKDWMKHLSVLVEEKPELLDAEVVWGDYSEELEEFDLSVNFPTVGFFNQYGHYIHLGYVSDMMYMEHGDVKRDGEELVVCLN